MSDDTNTAHQPLYDPAVDGTYAPSLDVVLECAREELKRYAAYNIHDHHQMLAAAVSHHDRLRQLVAALDKEAGR